MDMFLGWGSVEISDTKKCNAIPINNFDNYGVGDICASQTTINDKKALLVSVYITLSTTIRQFKQFFALNFLAYSPKLVGYYTNHTCW